MCEESEVRHKGIDVMAEAEDTHRMGLAGLNSDFQRACMHWVEGSIERVALCEVKVEEYDPWVIVVVGGSLPAHLEEEDGRDIGLQVNFHLSLQDLEGRKSRELT